MWLLDWVIVSPSTHCPPNLLSRVEFTFTFSQYSSLENHLLYYPTFRSLQTEVLRLVGCYSHSYYS